MNVVNKYVWLIELLERKKSLSLKEITSYWYDSDLNVGHTKLIPRTFNRWRQEIAEMFGIDINCGDAPDYKYSLDVSSDRMSGAVSWMINAMSISNLMGEFKSELDKIVLDDMPSGNTYLKPILNAIKKRDQLLLTYKRFQKEEPEATEIVNPLGLRLFERRWYAVVDFTGNPRRRLVSLDRIVSLQPLDSVFTYPDDFNVREYFEDDYGIDIGFNEKIERIVLRVTERQMHYLRTLPLHYTQKEIGTDGEKFLFEYYLKPTRSLARAILPWGGNIEVLEPVVLRSIVADMARKALENNYMPNEDTDEA